MLLFNTYSVTVDKKIPHLGYAKRYCDLTMPLSCRWCCPADHVGTPVVEGEQAQMVKKMAACACPICAKVFSTGSNMVAHFVRMHPDEWTR